MRAAAHKVCHFDGESMRHTRAAGQQYIAATQVACSRMHSPDEARLTFSVECTQHAEKLLVQASAVSHDATAEGGARPSRRRAARGGC